MLAKRVNNNETAGDGNTYNSKYYKLTNDIFLAQHNWQPISTIKGFFNGQNHTIYGLISDVNGFFNVINGGATVENLNLRDGVVKTNINSAGSLAGQALLSGVIKNINSNIYVETTSNSAGGIVGYTLSKINISLCTFDGMVVSTGVAGGIIGLPVSGLTMTNCTTDCWVQASDHAGALVGSLGGATATISNCSAKGTIDGAGNILVGQYGGGTITACSFYGSATSDDLTLPSGAIACYAVVNERKLISTLLDDPSWAENWVVVPELNNGLPMQKGLYWIGSDITTPVDKLKDALAGFKEPDAAA